MVSTKRNPEIAQGVNRFGRHRAAAKNFRFFKKGQTVAAKAAAEAKPITTLKWYSADDAKKPVPSRKAHAKNTKLRSSITPGTVLILLAGRFRGKRVVFLKQLPSGLLLVTGPYKVNGVPLRRVNQAYVIATSTKIDVSKADVSKIDDGFFKKSATKKTKKDGAEFFNKSEKKKPELGQARHDAQKSVDTAVLASVNATAHLRGYLSARFNLTKGQKPHAMKF